MDNQNTTAPKAEQIRKFVVLILVLMDNQNTEYHLLPEVEIYLS